MRVYTRQIVLGLEYLHKNNFMHRDIKGANILVDNTGLVKLADFGASKQIEDLVTIGEQMPDCCQGRSNAMAGIIIIIVERFCIFHVSQCRVSVMLSYSRIISF